MAGPFLDLENIYSCCILYLIASKCEGGSKKVHREAFKAKVALESVRGDLTANQICSRFGIHPTLVNRWRKEMIAGAGTIFSPVQDTRGAKKASDHDKLVPELFEQIGKLKMELEWLKKKLQSVD